MLNQFLFTFYHVEDQAVWLVDFEAFEAVDLEDFWKFDLQH